MVIRQVREHGVIQLHLSGADAPEKIPVCIVGALGSNGKLGGDATCPMAGLKILGSENVPGHGGLSFWCYDFVACCVELCRGRPPGRTGGRGRQVAWAVANSHWTMRKVRNRPNAMDYGTLCRWCIRAAASRVRGVPDAGGTTAPMCELMNGGMHGLYTGPGAPSLPRGKPGEWPPQCV